MLNSERLIALADDEKLTDTLVGSKRKRPSREKMKDDLRSPRVIDDHLKLGCCPASCLTKVSWSKVAEIRQSLFLMTQEEERKWRHNQLIPFVSARLQDNRAVPILGGSFCLRGFATVCGGPSYVRSCYRTLEVLSWTPNVEVDRIVLKDQSHRSIALRSYLHELLEQLCENDPVSGKKFLTGLHFQTVYTLYLQDVNEMGDEEAMSSSTVRRAWNQVLQDANASVRETPILNKHLGSREGA